MLKEFINQLFARKEAQTIIKTFDMLNLPFISKFKVFQFSGLADNNNLTPNFNLVDIQSRYLVIKAIKIVPYYANNSIDLFLTDGVTTNSETIPANLRINRLFDVYDYGVQLSVIINGSRIDMFPTEVAIVPPAADGNVPMDLDLDNIYYKFPEKISSFDIALDGRICEDIEGNAQAVPNVKVFVQCYLI